LFLSSVGRLSWAFEKRPANPHFILKFAVFRRPETYMGMPATARNGRIM